MSGTHPSRLLTEGGKDRRGLRNAYSSRPGVTADPVCARPEAQPGIGGGKQAPAQGRSQQGGAWQGRAAARF